MALTVAALEQCKAREENFKQLEAISNLGSWEVNLKTNLSTWSDHSYEIYGLQKEETTPSLELFFTHLVEEDRARAQEILSNLMVSGEIKSFECSIIDTFGKKKNLLLNGKVIFENKIPIKLIGTTQDVTEKNEVKRHSQELANVIKYSSNEIYIINKDAEYLYANQGAVDSLGYTLEELQTMTLYDTNPNLTKTEVKRMENSISKNHYIINRTLHERKDGSSYHAQAYVHSIKYNAEDAYAIFDTDISDIIALEQQLIHQANHDILTDLPNRALFKDRLSQALKSSARHKEEFALLFIDLDKFKQINDSLGHDIGDKVLIEVSKRLQKSIRNEDTLARIGGDEFIIILRNLKEADCSATVSKKIIHNISKEMEIDKHTLFISASIGISQCPHDATNESSLMNFADQAMYKAKEVRDSFVFYHDL